MDEKNSLLFHKVEVRQPNKRYNKEVLNMKEKDINSLEQTKWRCQYHIVFDPKFRRQVIYSQIETDIGKILRKLCEQKGVNII